jgi:hypothetical protein
VKLMHNLLKKQGFALDVLVMDKLRSYGGKVRNEIVGSPRAGLAQEQSSREFASADTEARVQGAAQIARISPALPFSSRRCSQHIERPASSHISPHAPRPQRRSVPDVANCYRSLNLSWAFQTPRRTSALPTHH